MITLTVEQPAQTDPERLIDGIWSGADWRAMGAGLKGLAFEYDDGRHQAVQICVARPVGHLAMSVMRFRDSATRISFFYARPPAGVVRQGGAWEAERLGGETRLRLIRTLQLQQRPSEPDAVFAAREASCAVPLRAHLMSLVECVVERKQALLF